MAENVDCDREGDTQRQIFQSTKQLQYSEAIPSLVSKADSSHLIKQTERKQSLHGNQK